MSLVNMGCILTQKADMDACVKYQGSLLEVKQGRLETALFAWTACNLWNSLPGCVQNIAGKDVEFFKNKLDKVLAYYPDVPRCSKFGHSYDRNFCKSNSLYDHYRDERISRVINSITKKSLGV